MCGFIFSFEELRTLCCDLFGKTFQCTNLFDQQCLLHHEFLCVCLQLFGHYDGTDCVEPNADNSVL